MDEEGGVFLGSGEFSPTGEGNAAIGGEKAGDRIKTFAQTEDDMNDVVFGTGMGEQRRDTKILELIAEHFVAHSLGRNDILCAKPYFDQRGADLLGMLSADRMALFCRIQCKGRTVNPSNHIEILEEYVDSRLVVFLFIEDGELDESNLYCFFEEEIKKWNKKTDENGNTYYQLNFTRNTFQKNLAPHKFSQQKADEIKSLISAIDLDQAYHFAKILIQSSPYHERTPMRPVPVERGDGQ